MRKSNIKSLYYITHVDNIPSILEHGILSHHLVTERNLSYQPIYNAQVVSNRRHRQAPNGKSLWYFANLYFQPRNPMLYQVIHQKASAVIAILGVRPDVLNNAQGFISTGNAASGPSDILTIKEGLSAIFQIWKIISGEWWNSEDGTKRKIMAECLIPDLVPPELIHTVYVSSHEAAEKLKKVIGKSEIPVVPEPYMFFQPNKIRQVDRNISLVDGDMFFSAMQTLTISVNTVGIMGKGIASRAKYQFPDVYVVYQDACREKKLQMGKPYLYKRESSLDEQLAEDVSLLRSVNANKWFLLFATKKHWKEHSDLEGIEQGLQWIHDHYQNEGIKSLAVPALGCGLGGLDWRDIGPLMCKYFAGLDIHVAIYLPREQPVAEELLSRDFLLGKSN
jgi:O-acetyl-ADP-ribose deacetylase (regulator of RNase III)